MKKALLAGMVCLFASASNVLAHTEPLTPRFMRIVGVQFQGAPWLLRFSCSDDKNALVYKSEGLQRGLIVSRTIDDSPAQEAGIHCGDLIIAADGRDVAEYKDLRSIIDSDPDGTSVRLTIARPVPVSINSNGVVFVRYIERRELDLSTIMRDRIAVLQKQPALEQMLSINDEFGKKFLLRSTTSFTERPNGMMEYSCSFSHEGEQEIVLLESAYFAALGSTELLPAVRRGETKTYTFTASIEQAGIPVRTSIPIQVDRHLYIGKVQEYIQKTERASGRNDEGDDSGDWHSWVPFTAECWVPESVARVIDLKRKRGS